MHKPIKERIEDGVMPVTETGCWLWVKAIDGKGYGVISLGRKRYGTHRVSWEVYKGVIPKGLCVLHKCDTPLCCNPEHLFLGTFKDNARDMVNKRRAIGQKRTHCKRGHELTIENVYKHASGFKICIECDRVNEKDLTYA